MNAGDLVDLLVEDHRAIGALFVRLSGGGGTPPQRRQATEVAVAELSRHAALEERFLYPAVRDLLGTAAADRGIAEHSAAERDLVALSKVDVTDQRFDGILARLSSAMRQHMEHEEAELFPELRDRCPPGRLSELGVRYREARELSPTRPHPLAPDTPPWNHVSSPVLGLVDHLRDELSGRLSPGG